MWLAVLFKLVSSLVMVVSNTLWKRPVQQEPFVNIIAIRAFFSSLLFAALFWLVYHYGVLDLPINLIGNLKQPLIFWISTIGLITLSYGGLFYFLKAIHSGKTITILAQLGGMAQIFSILTAVLFFKEELGLNRILSILFFILSILVYYRFAANKEEMQWRTKTIRYLILSCLIWGVSYTLLVKPMRVIGPLSIGLLTELVVFIIALTQVKFFSKQALKLNRPIKSYLYILGMACCIVVGMLLNNLSLTLLPVSMIVLIGLIIEVSYLFIGKLILKESLRKNEWWSFVLTTIALLLLVVTF
jgi:drug/metabolite transporter (DMT)-like permease